MIFAPRSWPSRPGLAMTTRIFAATARSIGTLTWGRFPAPATSRYRPDYENEVDHRRMLAGLAESRRGPVRVSRRNRRASRAPRLRRRRARQAPGARGLAPRRRDLPDALP